MPNETFKSDTVHWKEEYSETIVRERGTPWTLKCGGNLATPPGENAQGTENSVKGNAERSKLRLGERSTQGQLRPP